MKDTLLLAVGRDPDRPRLHTPWGQVKLWDRTWDMATDGHRLHAVEGTRYPMRDDAPPGAEVVPDPKRLEPVLRILNVDGFRALRTIPRKWMSWITVNQTKCLFSVATRKRDQGLIVPNEYLFRDVEVPWFLGESDQTVCIEFWYLLDAITHVDSPAITVLQKPGATLDPYLIHGSGLGINSYDRFAVVMPRRI